MEPSFELFDHTADVGIRAWAATMPELAVAAGEGLYAVIGEMVPAGEPQRLTVDLVGSESAVLLRDYLHELLILFDRDLRCATSVEVLVFDDSRLSATLETQLVDPQRSIWDHEVKAITYHELDIRKIAEGYEATLILDI
ncbi:MAG: archease [Planctomycetes bacterium]|nr:archease [Planctomycetota bacterium]